MKKFRRLSISIMISLIAILGIVSPVFAAPADVTGFVANPSNTYVIISWQPASGATSYVARYSTNTFPATPADGTSAYSGTQTMATVSSLTAGQTYYFSVWGYDGANYSPTATNVAATTLAVTIPSGAQVNPATAIPAPTIPPNATQTPVITGFSLQPFTNLFSYANNASLGGLGMPIGNLWEVIYIFVIVIIGLITYIRMKNFFVAYFVVVVLSMVGVGIHLVQGYLIPVELIVGLGVWALERFFQ